MQRRLAGPKRELGKRLDAEIDEFAQSRRIARQTRSAPGRHERDNIESDGRYVFETVPVLLISKFRIARARFRRRRRAHRTRQISVQKRSAEESDFGVASGRGVQENRDRPAVGEAGQRVRSLAAAVRLGLLDASLGRRFRRVGVFFAARRRPAATAPVPRAAARPAERGEEDQKDRQTVLEGTRDGGSTRREKRNDVNS